MEPPASHSRKSEYEAPYLRKRRVFGCTKWSAIRNTNAPINVAHHSGQSDAQIINSELRTGWK
jgi:hypothetical protein